MARKFSELGARLKLDPEIGRAQLLSLFRANGGNSTYVAKACGVNVSTVKRWIAYLDDVGLPIRSEVEKLRRAA